ncbi:galanin receptor 2b-like [Saccoglossus kowalevskii]|uniref:Substance-P receptor-like n=1 Tax=Saccoglossus kowalevskii TaxID=10224 RepID=A0ABM0MLY8_SACKO|nr:PREDICTED: substance-P receptor-like [Saccoglossus kowalevskii]
MVDSDINDTIGSDEYSSYSAGFFGWRESTLGLTIVHYIFAILGIGGNFIVCLVILRIKKLHTLTNYFLLHQSAIDLLATVVFIVTFLVPEYHIESYSVHSTLYCKLIWSEYLYWALMLLSSLNLSALSLERYFGIVHPIKHHNNFNIQKIKLIFVIEWLFSFIYLSYWTVLCDSRGEYCVISSKNEFWSKVGTFFDSFFLNIMPLGIMLFSYIKIFGALKNRVKPEEIKSSSQDKDNKKTINHWDRAKRNVVRTLCIVFVSFAICWFPSTVYDLLYVFGVPLNYDDTFYLIAVLFALFNMCVNPVIYTLQYEQFRKGLKQVFLCNKSNQPGGNSTVATTSSQHNIDG